MNQTTALSGEKPQLSSFVEVGSDRHVQEIQEMFSGQIDPDVVQLVMSECGNDVNEALEVLMTMTDEEKQLVELGEGNIREAPAEMEEIQLPEMQEFGPDSFSSENEANDTSFTNDCANEVGGVIKENNRISFIDDLSNEVYNSNEYLYERETNENSEYDIESIDQHLESVSSSLRSVKITDSTDSSKSESFGDHSKSSDINAKINDLKDSQILSTKVEEKAMTSAKYLPASNDIKSRDVQSNQKLNNKYWNSQKESVLKKIKSKEPVLVVLRGAPGSGKSTLANQLKADGIVLSTDDFFMKRIRGKMVYDFNPQGLSEAHEWNRKRFESWLFKRKTPIIIDNTNIEVWEMQPYLVFGIKHGYSICILEPTTPWKFSPRELTKKNSHGVPRKTIEKILERYENIHPDLILQRVYESMNKTNFISSDLSENKVRTTCSKNTELNGTTSNSKPVSNCKPMVPTPEIKSPEENQNLSLQELLMLSLQDSDCSKSSPDDLSEKSADYASWEAVTEQDKDYPFLMSSNSFENSYSNDIMQKNGPIKDSTAEKLNQPNESCDFDSGTWHVVQTVNDDMNESGNSSKAFKLPKSKKKSTFKNSKVPPLLDRDIKTKLSSENWILPQFPSPKIVQSSFSFDSSSSFVNASSMTEAKDFILFYKVINNVTCELDTSTVKIGTPKVFEVASRDDINTPLDEKPAVLMIDRSSMTEAPPKMEFNEALNSLKSMFPSLPSDDLADILEKCFGDHSWATDILLDSETEYIFESSSAKDDDYSPDCAAGSSFVITNLDEAHEGKNCFLEDEHVELEKENQTSGDEMVEMKIDPNFASQLLQQFGPVGNLSNVSDFDSQDLTVPIPIDLASTIHNLWKRAILENGLPERNVNKLIKSKQKKKKVKQDNCLHHHASENPFPNSTFSGSSKEPESFKEIMDYERALELSIQESRQNQKIDLSIELKRSYLIDQFPNIAEEALNDIFAGNQYSLENTINTLRIITGDRHEGAKRPTSELVADCENKIKEITSSNYENSLDNLHPNELREKARLHKKKKSDFMNQAQKAHGRGMPSVACYYSQQGHLEAEKIKEIDQLAANSIINEKNINRSKCELDLHGLHVKEAVSAVQKFISAKKQFLHHSMLGSIRLNIITGRGKHSEKGVSKVKKAVTGYLKSSKIIFNETNAGQLDVILTSK